MTQVVPALVVAAVIWLLVILLSPLLARMPYFSTRFLEDAFSSAGGRPRRSSLERERQRIRYDEVTEKLGLSKLRNRNWYIQESCAPTGEGLYDGLEWLRAACAGEL